MPGRRRRSLVVKTELLWALVVIVDLVRIVMAPALKGWNVGGVFLEENRWAKQCHLDVRVTKLVQAIE